MEHSPHRPCATSRRAASGCRTWLCAAGFSGSRCAKLARMLCFVGSLRWGAIANDCRDDAIDDPFRLLPLRWGRDVPIAIALSGTHRAKQAGQGAKERRPRPCIEAERRVRPEVGGQEPARRRRRSQEGLARHTTTVGKDILKNPKRSGSEELQHPNRQLPARAQGTEPGHEAGVERGREPKNHQHQADIEHQ